MTAIAIFVKTPGLSPVKTRLAACSGQAWAEAWHIRAARAVAETARAAQVGPVYWAVAESAASAGSHWPDLPLLEQGHGGLGERMGSILEWLVTHHGSGLLLGADAPQFQPAWLERAHDWLAAPDARLCLGPARDGGFWTFGANRVPERERWNTVHYSQASTCKEFRQTMQDLGEWLTLPALSDLDQFDDLAVMISELKALERPQPGQSALLAWLRKPGPSLTADAGSIQKC